MIFKLIVLVLWNKHKLLSLLLQPYIVVLSEAYCTEDNDNFAELGSGRELVGFKEFDAVDYGQDKFLSDGLNECSFQDGESLKI